MPAAPDKTGDLDEARLTALLDLAGQDLSRELARRLVHDFGGVAKALEGQGGALDRPVIRAQSHVLISLAGTVGAARLTDAARRLNALAHAADGEGLGQALNETLGLLQGLRSGLMARLAPLLGQP